MRRATKQEMALIRRLERLTKRIREVCEQRDAVITDLRTLFGDEEVVVRKEGEDRAMRVERPKGKYVVFPEWAVGERSVRSAEKRALDHGPMALTPNDANVKLDA